MAHSAKAGRSVPPRILTVLQVVRDGRASTVPDIVGLTGLPESVVDRWTRRFVDWRLLERTESGSHRAGLVVRLIGGGAPATESELLPGLAGAVPGKVRLGVLVQSRVAYVEGPATGSGRLTGAGVRPADAVAIGHALLAFGAHVAGPVRAAGPVPGAGQHGPSGKLAHALAVTRLSGTAITRRRAQGFRVAVPVVGAAGVALLAIEVTTPDLGDGFPAVHAALVAASRRLAEHPALQDVAIDDSPTPPG